MTRSSLREKFERLGPTRVVDQNRSGSREVLVLRPSLDLRDFETIPAIQALHKRGLTMIRAKRTIEKMVREGHAVALVPKVEDISALASDLRAHGVSAALVAPNGVDVRRVRERLGYSQAEFAQRYGLDLDSLQNWEANRRTMPKAVRSYVRVIDSLPRQVSEALEEAVLSP